MSVVFNCLTAFIKHLYNLHDVCDVYLWTTCSTQSSLVGDSQRDISFWLTLTSFFLGKSTGKRQRLSGNLHIRLASVHRSCWWILGQIGPKSKSLDKHVESVLCGWAYVHMHGVACWACQESKCVTPRQRHGSRMQPLCWQQPAVH